MQLGEAQRERVIGECSQPLGRAPLLSERMKRQRLLGSAVGFSFRADPPAKQITASSLACISRTGARSFSAGHSRPCPRFLPAPIVADGDADSAVAELRHDRPVAARENPPSRPCGDSAKDAPLTKT